MTGARAYKTHQKVKYCVAMSIENLSNNDGDDYENVT